MSRHLSLIIVAALLLTGPLFVVGSAYAQNSGDGTDAVATETTGEETPVGDAVFPDYRILSYYGFPGNEFMGILGEHEMADLLPILQEQGAAYEAVDPETPLALAYEVIASVAQADAGEDGNFLTHIDSDILDDYAEFCLDNDLLMILDLQFGRDTVQQELDWVRPWLELPHVHVALDPEFAIKEGEQPGVDLGTLTAEDIAYAQRFLVRLAEDKGLPPKILIVHQFNYYTLPDKELIEPMDGLQFVLEVDGWGPPDDKRETYRVLTEDPIEYHGFKLWYRQDDPLMSADDVLALDPKPDIVIYQ